MTGRTETFGLSGQSAWARGRASAEYLHDLTAGMSHEERLAQVKWLASMMLASMMDDRFGVPGTKLRFGMDSVLVSFLAWAICSPAPLRC